MTRCNKEEVMPNTKDSTSPAQLINQCRAGRSLKTMSNRELRKIAGYLGIQVCIDGKYLDKQTIMERITRARNDLY